MDNYDRVMGSEANPDATFGWTKPLALTGKERKCCGLPFDHG